MKTFINLRESAEADPKGPLDTFYFNMWLAKENWGFKGKPGIFFCELVSLIFLAVLVVSRILFGSKSWNHGGFMKFGKKISWNHLGIWLGPRAGAEARGPNQMPKWFQLFFAELHEYHQVFKIYCQKYSWIPPKLSKKSMNTRSQK